MLSFRRCCVGVKRRFADSFANVRQRFETSKSLPEWFAGALTD